MRTAWDSCELGKSCDCAFSNLKETLEDGKFGLDLLSATNSCNINNLKITVHWLDPSFDSW